MTSLTGSRGPTGGNTNQSMAGSNTMGKPKAPPGYKTFEQFTPEMMELFMQLFSHVGPDSFLSKLASGDQSMFEEMEAPAYRQFNALQGQNASRFSGMGMGARRGSGFKNEMDSATSNFAQDLQSKRLGLQRQAIQDLKGFSSELLGKEPYGFAKKEPSFFDKWLDMAGNVMGTAIKAAPGFF